MPGAGNGAPPSAMEFITLTSGDTAMSPLSDVGPDVILRIQDALAKPGGQLWAGWAVEQIPTPAGGHVFDMVLNGTAMSRCWVCSDSAVSDRLWEACKGSAPPMVVLHRPRGVPWLAVALLPGAITVGMADPSKLMELADAERCVAWALLIRP